MHPSSPYHPNGNSIVKRSQHTIDNILRATMLEDPGLTWKDLLPAVQMTINTAEHSAHSFMPTQLILDTTASLPDKCPMPLGVPHPTLSSGHYLE